MFWIIIMVLLISTALALGLTFMVIGVDMKSSNNRFFALFMITVAIWSLTNIIMRLMLFYESGPIGVIYRLVSISYVLICPSLLLFTVRYLNKKPLWADIFYLGLLSLIGAALFLSDGSSIHEAPVLTDGYNVSYSFSAMGYILTSIYIAPGIVSAILFYKDKRTGDISCPYMVGGTLFILIGYIIGGFQVIQIPASPFTFIFSLVIFGYMVLRLQVFNPLRESEEKQRAILNATTESIILIDLDGDILTLNDTAAERLGRSPEELIGKGITEYLPLDLVKERSSLADELTKTGKPIRFQDKHDGILLDNNLYPVFDKNKTIYAIAIYSNDITELEEIRTTKIDLEEYNRELEAQVLERTRELNERMKGSERSRIATLNMLEDISETKKELENSEKLYSTVVNTSMDGIFIVQDNKIRFVNSSFITMMGYDEEELIDKALNELFHGDIQVFIQDLYDPKEEGGILPELFETLFLTRSGENIPVEVRTSEMKYKGKDAIINFTKDMREAVKLEVGIAEALSLLQQSEKRREEFIDMAAHELRTPLTAIKTYVEMMGEGYMGEFDKEEMDHIEILGKSITKLNEQITGMLDASKVLAGQLKAEKVLVDMKDITEDVIEEFQPLFTKKHQTLSLNVSEVSPILANPELMTSVMRNLIGNANKFTPENGSVNVLLFTEEDNKIHIVVKDTGIGISENDLPNIFERFFIGDRSLTGQHPQLGLGLSVVKVIIEQHKGSVWVTSIAGEGSVFHFTLPTMEGKIKDQKED